MQRLVNEKDHVVEDMLEAMYRPNLILNMEAVKNVS